MVVVFYYVLCVYVSLDNSDLHSGQTGSEDGCNGSDQNVHWEDLLFGGCIFVAHFRGQGCGWAHEYVIPIYCCILFRCRR
jgi:hypothetical protein